MGAIIAMAVVLCSFFLRDFLVFRIGPQARTRQRLVIYAIALAVYLMAFLTVTSSLAPLEILHRVRTPFWSTTILAIHLVFAAASIWMRRARQYQWVWLVVISPNPLLISILAVCSRTLARVSPLDVAGGLLASVLWTALLLTSIQWSRRTPVDRQEEDFSVEVAAVTNSFALMFVPFELLFG